MAFLPERHHPLPPQVLSKAEPRHDWLTRTEAAQWRPVKQRTSPVPFMLTAVLAASVTWLVRITIDASRPTPPAAPVSRHAETPPATPGPAPAPHTAIRCTEPDGKVRGWSGNGSSGGIGLHDVLEVLPKCDGGHH